LKTGRFLAIALMLVAAKSAPAAYISIGEVGNTFGSATNVDSYFDLASDPDIFNSTTITHASILSSNDATDDVDWYSFTAGGGNTLDIDIDYAEPSFDSTLALYDSSGNLLAYTDDNGDPLDPGTVHPFDSFLGTYILPTNGLYYVAVSNYANFPSTIGNTLSFMTTPGGAFGGSVVDGGSNTFTDQGFYSSGTYTLHISTDHALSAVPEPTSLVLFGLGAIGTASATRLRRRSLKTA
jgi:hypothetical protein